MSAASGKTVAGDQIRVTFGDGFSRHWRMKPYYQLIPIYVSTETTWRTNCPLTLA